MRKMNIVFLLLMLVGLTACGGGTESSNDEFSVIGISPENNSTNVKVDSKIDVNFSPELNVDTINLETFKLVASINGSELPIDSCALLIAICLPGSDLTT